MVCLCYKKEVLFFHMSKKNVLHFDTLLFDKELILVPLSVFLIFAITACFILIIKITLKAYSFTRRELL